MHSWFHISIRILTTCLCYCSWKGFGLQTTRISHEKLWQKGHHLFYLGRRGNSAELTWLVKAEGAERSQGAGVMVPRARAEFGILVEFLLDALLEFAGNTTETLVVVRGLISVSPMTLLERETPCRLLVDIVWQQ